MFLNNLENYISHFKIFKIHNNEDLIIIKKFIKNYLDKNGYIDTSNINLNNDLIKLIQYILIKKNLNNVFYLLNNLKEYLNVFNNKKIFYKEYFETLGINFSTLVTTNILYDEISKIIFLIYIYGTTIINFKFYILNNENFKKNVNMKYLKILNNHILQQDFLQTYNFDSNSFKILILGHLHYENFIIQDKIIVENILFMYGRIVLEIINEKPNISKKFIKSMFDNFLNQYSAPSSPMYYNAFKNNNVLTSCFIISMEDNVQSIGFNLNKIFNIQKHNSGIGVILSKIRPAGRPVMNGVTESNSVLNFINILSLLSHHYDNKKRNRSSNININLSIYHPEVYDFLKLKVNKFKQANLHSNKIFQTIIIPDIFLIYLLTGRKYWFLIPSDQHINNIYLHDVHGQEFNNLYEKMIEDNNIIKVRVDIEELFSEIVNTMIKTGGPFLLFEDIVNYTSNHKQLGKINGTNLCTEILEYTDDNNTACCNVSSINLSQIYYTKNNKNYFDFNKLKKVIKKVVFYLNTSIDKTYYGDNTCKTFNKKYRPIAIGIQGLANLFNILGIKYLEGKDLYKKIIEYMYYYSLLYSNNFCKNKIFEKCSDDSNNIITERKFHFELFKEFQENKINTLNLYNLNNLSSIIDTSIYNPKYISIKKWNNLKNSIINYGLSNSLVLGFMPTSISSVVYNNNESFEPFQQNIEKKSVSVYDCIVYNKMLVKDLLKINSFDETNVLKKMIDVNGDINKLNLDDTFDKYKTLYELDFIDYLKFTNVADPFVDQGISFNLSIKDNNNDNIAKLIIGAWLLGKKTTYYYRTNTIIEPLSFNKKINIQTNITCDLNGVCTSCST